MTWRQTLIRYFDLPLSGRGRVMSAVGLTSALGTMDAEKAAITRVMDRGLQREFAAAVEVEKARD